MERLHTVEKLASAGRALGNCTKDNGYGLHDNLRQRRSDFYAVLCSDSIVAMLEAKLATNRISQLLGKENDDVELPRSVLFAMLKGLRLNGDSVDGCLQRGAASVFVTGKASRLRPDYWRGSVRVWWHRRLILVREGRSLSGGWSIFRWDGSLWCRSEASSRDRLDSLLTLHPHIATLAERAARMRIGRRPRRRPKRSNRRHWQDATKHGLRSHH